MRRKAAGGVEPRQTGRDLEGARRAWAAAAGALDAGPGAGDVSAGWSRRTARPPSCASLPQRRSGTAPAPPSRRSRPQQGRPTL